MRYYARITRVLLLMLVLLFMATGANAKTRTAQVGIQNNTGHRILSATLVHKYSDDWMRDYTWKDVKSGYATNNSIDVHFNTGVLTTGKDWWFVTWIDDTGCAYMSKPKNLRGLMDLLEKAGQYISGGLIESGIDVLVADPELIGKAIGAAAAVTGAIGLVLLNSEGTAGFKQHILRDKDAGHYVRIHLHTGHIVIDSQSGKSKTGVQKCKPKKGELCHH